MTKRDLMRKLQSVRTTERVIVPDQAFVARTREHLLLQVRNTLPTQPAAMPVRARSAMRLLVPPRLTNLMRAPALAILSVMITVLGGSIASVSASDRSLPGDFLYPIKIATEQTRLAFTSGKAERLVLKSSFVDRRVEEIQKIAATPAPEQQVRLKQAAEDLKRDLNTVKLQVTEVRAEQTKGGAEAVKIVDKASAQIIQNLQLVKNEASPEVKSSIAEAEVAAVHTGVTAVEALLEASTNPDTEWIVSEADVRQSITNKVDRITASLTDSEDKLRSISDSSNISNQLQATGTGSNLLQGMTSTTVGQFNAASTTLQEARTLLNANKLSEVSGKLLEASKAAAQAETAADLLVASSTQSNIPIPFPVITSSTPATAPEASSTATSTTSPP